MPIYSPDIFCFRIQMAATTTTVTSTPFTDIGVINEVAGTPCTTGWSPPPPDTAWGFTIDTSLDASTQLDLKWNQGITTQIRVWWGDGNVENYSWNGFQTASHTYASDGVYDVYVQEVVGEMSTFTILPPLMLVDVLRWTDWRGTGQGATSLSVISATDEPDWRSAPANPNLGSFFRNSPIVSGVGHWTTVGTNNGSSIFRSADNFNEDLSGWDTSGWTSTSLTFFSANSWDQDIGMWNIGLVTSASQMIESSGLSTANYDKLLIGWAAQAPNIQTGVIFTRGPQYTVAAQAARNVLVGTYLWAINDGGLAP